ncbi:transposase [Streptomyces atratus]|uniref:transposase n=1 Tax=Streptomyces atratus TaxID=1893 RepID=UPI003648B237
MGAVRQESDGTYGAPKATAELRETSGEVQNDNCIARLMQPSGTKGPFRRRRRTTVGEHDAELPTHLDRAGPEELHVVLDVREATHGAS